MIFTRVPCRSYPRRQLRGAAGPDYPSLEEDQNDEPDEALELIRFYEGEYSC